MAHIVVDRLDHVAINVTDVQRAREFYGGLLGLREIARPASFDFPGAWYRIGPVDLHLIGREVADGPSRRHIALSVSDVFEAARMVEAAGYPVEWERHRIEGVRRFFTDDPDQNRVELQGREISG
jgi:glyoxylase I family protein